MIIIRLDVNKGGEIDFFNFSGGLFVLLKKGDVVFFWNNRFDGF